MSKEKKYMTCDGNQAAAHIAYMFSEVAAIYPITPSSTMAEHVDEWAAQGRKNMFGETVLVQEMQSEAGAAGAVHGSLQTGALTSTFTASQGLLLMIPNMYKIAGELLPTVFHVSARAIAAQSLSIFGDHQDVMSARATGFAQLSTGSVQEVMDLAGVAHLSTIKTRVPFIHFFDGFRTSHEIQKIEYLEGEDLFPLIDQEALSAFRKRGLNSDHPVTRGTAQNDDIYFQTREASNPFYQHVPEVVQHYMDEIAKITGRQYHLFDYYGAEDAENIIIAMGSVNEAIREVIDVLMKEGRKVGLVAVRLFRPFSAKHLLNAIPKTVKRIAVLDRTKEPGSAGEPLYLDVKQSLYGQENAPLVVGGRYGLSSKDTTPSQILAVYDNLDLPMPKNNFTIGIVDDVTFTSLPEKEGFQLDNEGLIECKFYGLGSDGTVGANKNSIKIIGDSTDKYCQAYFQYDSKKSGGFTCSHLRFGDHPIRSTYYVNNPHFLACHVPAYLRMYDITKGLRKGGTFLLNSIWGLDEIEEHLPNRVKRYLAQNDINFYMINATEIAQEIGMGNRTNTILQSAFFKIANIIPYDEAKDQMKKFIVKSYGKKGEDVVQKNYLAVERGEGVIKVPVKPEWANLPDDERVINENDTDFIKNVVRVINAQAGYDLPVSAFTGREDGTWEAGTSKSEKRGVAANVPEWKIENCIQCNQCAYVCPHATIRPFLLDEEENAQAPEEYQTLKSIGKQLQGTYFRIQVDVLDCLGCGNCADVCPGNKNGKALEMKPLTTQLEQQKLWDYSVAHVTNKAHLVDVASTVKNSQFAQPLFEFSGACAGCGETPYVKLLTQLFGSRQVIANATGCSSIYSASSPSSPYTTNVLGQGPAWANSLFEDNAEFGFGMHLASKKMRARLISLVTEMVEGKKNAPIDVELLKEWLEHHEDGAMSREISNKVIAALKEAQDSPEARALRDLEGFFVKRSQWIIGGDGWAYDIGYGGLDHVVASGENVNILVLDTEVYSNTGGQSSKSTPTGAIAKFAASGKRIRKKDLGMMAASYGYVYVAQIAMGANQAQALKAIREAESFDGPSLVIAYSPCIEHGLRAGMGRSQVEQKHAVECGYWHLWRHDPRLEEEGKNPFTLDSKEPNWEGFHDFLLGEVRYSSLFKQFPEKAEELFAAAEQDAKYRYNKYKRLANISFAEVEETK
ncbi:MAG: pyruvate:ferredoxin (flavodoxin) oxidoreductase [Porphyromonas sp.]|nr:pyruvate:ferredoxin (flavodoxin) oxidoreductase [Porphyromonas sp.]